jgi:hypothetical protein
MEELARFIADVSKQFCEQPLGASVSECELMRKYNLTSTISTAISGMGAAFSRMQVEDPSAGSDSVSSSWMESTKVFGIQVDWLSAVFEMIQSRFLQAVSDQRGMWRTQADAASASFIILVVLIATLGVWVVVYKIEEMIWYSKGLLHLIPTAIIQQNEDLREAIVSQEGLDVFK